MKPLLQKLLKLSAREAFETLRGKGPFFCSSIAEYVSITRVFWGHIIFSKERHHTEVQERLLILNFIPRIFRKGYVQNDSGKYIRLALKCDEFTFILILERLPSKIILLSCFREYTKK